MGFPPPPNNPPPSQQKVATIDAGFSDSKPAASLCGFKIPLPYLKFGLNIPNPFKLPPFPPKIKLSLGINCSLSNPVDFSAGLEWGGGRKGTRDPDPDD
jgi:hypothetical protein